MGSGKTALLDCLCKAMRDRYQLAVVTNDIFTREDMEFLMRSEALPAERIMVEAVGETHATAADNDFEGMARERRVTMTIVDQDTMNRVAREVQR